MGNCRFCGNHLNHTFIDLGNQPPSNSFLTKEQLDLPEIYYPLRVYVCERCFLVQLPEVKKASEIFKDDYVYYSSESPANVAHAKEYVKMIINRFNPLHVLEIGSNDGYMLQWFKEKGCDVLGVDPADGPATIAIKKKDIPTFRFFFGIDLCNKTFIKDTKFDLICSINTIAHQPDINDFVAGIKIALAPNGVTTHEFPHLMNLVEKCQFDTIYHEHYSYFSFITICLIFEKHGLEIFDVEQIPEHGGSLRIYAQHEKTGKYPVNVRVPRLFEEEYEKGMDTLAYYQGFQGEIDKIKRDIIRLLNPSPLFIIDPDAFSKNFDLGVIRPRKIWITKEIKPPTIIYTHNKIAAYGAAAKGVTFLNYCGIRSDLISFVVDRSPHKIGKYLPGSHIPVVSEDVLKEQKPAYVLILAWNLKNEIMEQLKYIREWNGIFIVAAPKLEVL